MEVIRPNLDAVNLMSLSGQDIELSRPTHCAVESNQNSRFPRFLSCTTHCADLTTSTWDHVDGTSEKMMILNSIHIGLECHKFVQPELGAMKSDEHRPWKSIGDDSYSCECYVIRSGILSDDWRELL